MAARKSNRGKRAPKRRRKPAPNTEQSAAPGPHAPGPDPPKPPAAQPRRDRIAASQEPAPAPTDDLSTDPPLREPAATKAHAKAHFEKWAHTYDRSWLNELVFFPSVRRCQEEIYRWQAPRADRTFRMLDVGCGTGTLLSLIARHDAAEMLVGLDYAEEMVRRAAAKFAEAEQPHKLQAVRGDAERLPFADESFDVLTCCNSFHHYPHQARAVAEFRRVLRTGGILILIDGFRDNVIGWLIFDVAVALVEKQVHHAPWSQVRRMMQAAGFSGIRQEKMNVLAPLLVNIAVR